MCKYCDKEGGHAFFCTFCKGFYGCTHQVVRADEHLKNGSCVLQWCSVHEWHKDKPGSHYQTCKMCQSTYDCDKKCPNTCCAMCATQYTFCHCDGGCGQPGCNCKKWSKSEPQHNIKTLETFGAVDEKGKAFNLIDDAREFYGAIAMWDYANPAHREIVEEIAARQAKRFLAAIMVAVAGEIRSIAGGIGKNYVNRVAPEKKWDAERTKEMRFHFDEYYIMSRPRGLGTYVRRVKAGGLNGEDAQHRTGSANVFKKYVIDRYGQKAALRHAVNFWRIQGGGGVGGVKWADAAAVGLAYVRGELTDIEFVDSAFNLQHNNAILFTKSHHLEDRHTKYLDMRREAPPEWSILRAPPALRKKMGYADFKPTAAVKVEAHTKPVENLKVVVPQASQQVEIEDVYTVTTKPKEKVVSGVIKGETVFAT